MKCKKLILSILMTIFVSSIFGLAEAAEQIHGMRFPELSPDGSTLVFSYQGDIWRVPSTGGGALRLTAHDAYDGISRFSPDGQRLAFESKRFGSTNVFVVQSDGSNSPHRVTYSSDTENLGCWYPSGDYLMLETRGPMGRNNLVKRDLKNSLSVPLFEDTQIHYNPVITSDGETVFYLRAPASVRDWRSGYKGSAGGDIWSYGLKSKKHNLVYENNRSKHFLRLGHDETYLLFVDYVHQGSSNIAKFDLKTGELSYLTDYVNDTVRNITVDKNGVIVYEYMNDLWRLEPGKNPDRIVVFASAEDKRNNHELKTMTSGFWGINISDNDKLVAIEIDGDIFVYRTDGEVDNKAVSITNTSDKLEAEPVFSLDGKSLYFFVSEGYGRNLVKVSMVNLDKSVLVESGNMLRDLKRIPTTDLLSFMRGFGEIIVFNPDDNSSNVIFKEKKISPGTPTQLSWSPDGRFLTISASHLGNEEIYVIERETKKKWNISNYYKDNSNPFFSPDGKWLAFQTYTSPQNEVKLVELNPETFLDKTSLVIEEEEEDE
ncbi:hypothetical protein KKB99_05895, partial [bacterium]|nr:hypothetical protein [bacterium]MBU1025519.1 hypothetical protein [bacterium]